MGLTTPFTSLFSQIIPSSNIFTYRAYTILPCHNSHYIRKGLNENVLFFIQFIFGFNLNINHYIHFTSVLTFLKSLPIHIFYFQVYLYVYFYIRGYSSFTQIQFLYLIRVSEKSYNFFKDVCKFRTIYP